MNFMERVVCFVFVLLFCCSVVVGDSWGDINVEDNNSVVGVASIKTDMNPIDSSVDNDVISVPIIQDVSPESGRFFTTNFYIALWIVLGILVVLGVFIWFWIKGPKNKWE